MVKIARALTPLVILASLACDPPAETVVPAAAPAPPTAAPATAPANPQQQAAPQHPEDLAPGEKPPTM